MDTQGVKSLGEAIKTAVDAGLLEARTATPARIESYDASDQRATVLPLLQRATASGELVSPGPITNVPVQWPRGGGFAITLPLAAGDVGLLICSDRSLDRWLDAGGVVDPQSRRHHAMTDAVFVPGLHHWGDPIAQPTGVDLSEDVVIAKEDGDCWVSIRADGEVRIKGSAVRIGNPAASAALALATLVDARLTTLQAAHDAHVHPVPGVTVGPGATTSSIPTSLVGALPSTAAAKVFGE